MSIRDSLRERARRTRMSGRLDFVQKCKKSKEEHYRGLYEQIEKEGD